MIGFFFISSIFTFLIFIYESVHLFVIEDFKMKNKKDIEIFDGKSFQDLTKDIYENTQNKKKQIDLLIQEIHGFIQTVDDVVMIAPIIKEYMEVSIKNDEHLVKLAGVLQRIVTKSVDGTSDESMLLSDEEKEELMSTLQDTVNDLQEESDRFNKIKDETTKHFMGN